MANRQSIIPKKSRYGLLWIPLSLFVLVCLLYIGWFNRYPIYDWIKLRNYNPPVAVMELAEQTTMTKYGKDLFYVNDPVISDKSNFQKLCHVTEQTIVLGCYTGNRIYIYKVDDPALNGIEQVTAAHEMLHAAYDRLSPKERRHVDEMVKAAYNRINDPTLKETYASYHKSEPGHEWNEMFAVLGTEYSNLGTELEDYYTKYFTDRAKVVNYAQKYQKVFNDLKNQVQEYDAQLALMKPEIDQRTADVEALKVQIESKKAEMDRLLSSNQKAAYNAQVDSYNAMTYQYNSQLVTLRNLINQYNSVVEQRNKISLQQQALMNSIDSRDTIQMPAQ